MGGVLEGGIEMTNEKLVHSEATSDRWLGWGKASGCDSASPRWCAPPHCWVSTGFYIYFFPVGPSGRDCGDWLRSSLHMSLLRLCMCRPLNGGMPVTAVKLVVWTLTQIQLHSDPEATYTGLPTGPHSLGTFSFPSHHRTCSKNIPFRS